AAAHRTGAGRNHPAHRIQGEANHRRSRSLPEGRETMSLDDWEKNELAEFLRKQPESKQHYETLSGIPVKRVYVPEDMPPFEEIGLPGKYPYTRGPYPTMYHGRLWTMPHIPGFGTGA